MRVSKSNSEVKTTAKISASALKATPAEGIQATTINLTLGTPTQIFHLHQPDAMGMFNVPDMHTAVLMQPDGSYLLWITGDIGTNGKGSVAMLSTRDFLTYRNTGPGTIKKAEPVFSPSLPNAGSASCWQNYDSDYVGANAVLTAANGKDLLMFYEAGNRNYGPNVHGPEYNVIALARSNDNGLTWTRQGPVISGTDPKPEIQTGDETTQPGVSEPGLSLLTGTFTCSSSIFPTITLNQKLLLLFRLHERQLQAMAHLEPGPNSTMAHSARSLGSAG